MLYLVHECWWVDQVQNILQETTGLRRSVSKRGRAMHPPKVTWLHQARQLCNHAFFCTGGFSVARCQRRQKTPLKQQQNGFFLVQSWENQLLGCQKGAGNSKKLQPAVDIGHPQQVPPLWKHKEWNGDSHPIWALGIWTRNRFNPWRLCRILVDHGEQTHGIDM